MILAMNNSFYTFLGVILNIQSNISLNYARHIR